MSRVGLALAVLLSGLFVTLAATPEAAAQTANVRVRVIHATNDGRGIAGSLSDIGSQLTSRFGRDFDTFRLTANNSLTLNIGTPRSVSLPNGQQMGINFVSTSGGRTSFACRCRAAARP